MSWVMESSPAGFADVFALRDNLYREYRAFEAVFTDEQLLDPTLMSLCRLRAAQLHRCEPEQRRLASSVSASRGQKLRDWHRSPDFSPLEKAALSLTECFCQDPHSITDEMAAAVVAEIGDEGLVALLEYLALCDGFIRFQVMLEVSDD